MLLRHFDISKWWRDGWTPLVMKPRPQHQFTGVNCWLSAALQLLHAWGFWAHFDVKNFARMLAEARDDRGRKLGFEVQGQQDAFEFLMMPLQLLPDACRTCFAEVSSWTVTLPPFAHSLTKQVGNERLSVPMQNAMIRDNKIEAVKQTHVVQNVVKGGMKAEHQFMDIEYKDLPENGIRKYVEFGFEQDPFTQGCYCAPNQWVKAKIHKKTYSVVGCIAEVDTDFWRFTPKDERVSTAQSKIRQVYTDTHLRQKVLKLRRKTPLDAEIINEWCKLLQKRSMRRNQFATAQQEANYGNKQPLMKTSKDVFMNCEQISKLFENKNFDQLKRRLQRQNVTYLQKNYNTQPETIDRIFMPVIHNEEFHFWLAIAYPKENLMHVWNSFPEKEVDVQSLKTFLGLDFPHKTWTVQQTANYAPDQGSDITECGVFVCTALEVASSLQREQTQIREAPWMHHSLQHMKNMRLHMFCCLIEENLQGFDVNKSLKTLKFLTDTVTVSQSFQNSNLDPNDYTQLPPTSIRQTKSYIFVQCLIQNIQVLAAVENNATIVNTQELTMSTTTPLPSGTPLGLLLTIPPLTVLHTQNIENVQQYYNISGNQFELQAFIVHSGTQKTGHYICFRKFKGKLYKCDDKKIFTLNATGFWVDKDGNEKEQLTSPLLHTNGGAANVYDKLHLLARLITPYVLLYVSPASR